MHNRKVLTWRFNVIFTQNFFFDPRKTKIIIKIIWENIVFINLIKILREGKNNRFYKHTVILLLEKGE